MNTRFSFVRTLSFAALFAFAVSVPVAGAQNTQPLAKATVPFAFQYGSRAFPAGKYTFARFSGNFLQIRGDRSSAIGLVEWTEDSGQARTGKLVFHRDGNRYVLRDIWVPEISAHLRCAQARERKHREVVETKAASSDVEVALLESPR